MKLRYTALLVMIALFATTANASLQKPNWGIGDYWEYRGNYSVDEETSYENMSVRVSIQTHDLSLKLEVKGIENVNIGGREIACYKTKLISSSSGSILIEGNLGGNPVSYSGNFNLDGNGFIYFTTSGLEVAKNDLTVNITTDISLPNMPNGAMSISMEYSPPLDFMKFPLDKGEKWTANSTVTINYGGISTQSPVSFSFDCIGKQGSVYIIKSGYNPFEEFIPVNNTLLFWDGDIGMIKEIKDIGGTQSLDIKLIDHKYSNITNEPPVADFTWKPAQPKAGDNVIFNSGNSYDGDGTIVSYFWQFGDGKNSTKANPTHVYSESGTYNVTLTVTDDYGAIATITKKIIIGDGGGGGSSGGGGGNGTPGFELLLLIAAILVISWRKFTIFK